MNPDPLIHPFTHSMPLLFTSKRRFSDESQLRPPIAAEYWKTSSSSPVSRRSFIKGNNKWPGKSQRQRVIRKGWGGSFASTVVNISKMGLIFEKRPQRSKNEIANVLSNPLLFELSYLSSSHPNSFPHPTRTSQTPASFCLYNLP